MFQTIRAEISRSRLIGNFSRLRALAQQTSHGNRCDLLTVVKANAYGHEVSLCAPWLVAAGAPWLGVTCVREGVVVRRLCPDARILVMSGLQPDDAETLLDSALTPTVWDFAHLEALSELATRYSLAPQSIPIHLEIDTGMSRQGVSSSAAKVSAVLERICKIPALHLDGVFTHFASPEELDAEQNKQQMMRFRSAVEHIAAAGFRPRWIHAGSSSTLLGQRYLEPLVTLAKHVDADFLLRPGIALYGYALPFTGGSPAASVNLQPVLAWKTAIASLRAVQPGTKIGYNGTFIAKNKMQLALLPVGYADGLNRKLSNCGHVLIHGIPAPIVGRVSMDLTIVDVSHIPNAIAGDEVVVLGEQNGRRITADDHARWAETISYEILCAIGRRVSRIPRD